MKDLKHIKRFNESEENLNISDVGLTFIGYPYNISIPTKNVKIIYK